METAVTRLFERYERIFNESLGGDIDMDEMASLYASEFIAASPVGVATGKNDENFRQMMTEGYAHYRMIGTREMHIRKLRSSPMDECHCIAHVAWTASHARKDLPDVKIDFDVHYLVRKIGAEAKVFGWVAGDEQALLKKHGVV